jgi:hypothetical protein
MTDDFVLVGESKERDSSAIFSAPTSSKVFTTTLPDGKIVAWVHRYDPTIPSETTSSLGAGPYSCNTCKERSAKLARYVGPMGALLFENEGTSSDDMVNKLREYASANAMAGSRYQMVLVKNDTFPASEYTGPGSQSGPFYHMTIVPDAVTDTSLQDRMTRLWPKVISSVKERLSKFLCAGARDTMAIIATLLDNSAAHGLERPEYWKPTFDWIREVQTKFPTDYDAMSQEEKEELCVWAMATGHAVGNIHYNFQTAANFVDFMVMTSLEAIKSEMDKRSDPRTNQVSQLARAKAAKGVTSNYGVGLVWDGKEYRDDLDLHVITPWGECWYSQKQVLSGGRTVAKLDFDAGINGTEDEPAENVTLCDDIAGKSVGIYIDNYTRRSQGDVECTIVITQKGNEDIVIPVVWPKDRHKGDLLHVATHTFTAIEPDVEEVKMSEAQARAMAAQAKEFDELFGVPTSCIATVNDIARLEGGEVCYVREAGPAPVPADEPESKDSATDALSELSALAGATMARARVSGGGGSGKKFLSARMAAGPPTTVTELLARLSKGDARNITVHLQDHVPGYVTKVAVTSDRALHGGAEILSSCHYQDKFQHPIVPTKAGNARLDPSWTVGGYATRATVRMITKVGDKFFFGLDGMKLPLDSAAFPVSAGFYPQHLSGEGHKHRSKWAFLNTSVKPDMADQSMCPAIGTFLTGDVATVFVDGQRLVLRTV